MIKINSKCEVVIIGGGMVGLTLAYQLIERRITTKIIVIDKEEKLGVHSSGRNSGVLHAGVYYEPKSLKAKVCVEGSRRLKKWVIEHGLELNSCGKLIIPQRVEQDTQLDRLKERANENGAKVNLINNNEVKKIVKDAESCSGRALWSPETAVVDPEKIIRELERQLGKMGVQILKGENNWRKTEGSTEIILKNGNKVQYDYLINAAGVFSEKIAKKFGVGEEYRMMPFKGLYWKLKRNCPLTINTNVYPVPDLNLPFLGVHLTPSVKSKDYVSIGPTATPALGRENYRGLNKVNINESAMNIMRLASKYIKNEDNIREYTNQQAFLLNRRQVTMELATMIPTIQEEFIERSDKVGIRAQLYNTKTNKLENDFIYRKGVNSVHILNAISPAFSASFALADEIIDRAEL